MQQYNFLVSTRRIKAIIRQLFVAFIALEKHHFYIALHCFFATTELLVGMSQTSQFSSLERPTLSNVLFHFLTDLFSGRIARSVRYVCVPVSLSVCPSVCLYAPMTTFERNDLLTMLDVGSTSS